MTPTEYLEENNNELKLKLEKNLLRNKVTKEMMDFAKEYHTQQLILSGVVKSFTTDEVLNVLDSSYELIDAISFFEYYKKQQYMSYNVLCMNSAI